MPRDPRGARAPRRAAHPDDHLPLREAHYLILLALHGQDLHGYAVRKAVEERTDGAVRLGTGSLYRSLGQLRDEGLIAESDWRPPTGLDDERRTYFRLTELGRAVASAETERLAALVAGARAAGLGGEG